MKKTIFAILAILTVLIMVSCPESSPSPKPQVKEFTVKFNANGGSGTAPADMKVKEGESITLPTKGNLTGPADKTNFVGWSETAAGPAITTDKYKPTKNITLYAVWSAVKAPAVITLDANGAEGTLDPLNGFIGEEITLPGGVNEEPEGLTPPADKPFFIGWATTAEATLPNVSFEYTPTAATVTLYAVWAAEEAVVAIVTFDANGAEGEVPEPMETVVGGTIQLPSAGGLSKAGHHFGGWSDDGTPEDALDAGADFVVTEAEVTLYAVWHPDQEEVLDTEGAEYVNLPNAFYAIYQFTIPVGSKLGNYKGLTADYMFTEEMLAAATERNARIMGSYKITDFSFTEGTGDADGVYLAVANYNNDKNTPFILDGGQLSNKGDPGSLLTALAGKGINAVGGEWFTYDLYDITGGNKNSGYVDTNLPDANYTGVIYLGIGLPGAGNTNLHQEQYIRNVKLVPFEDTAAEVVGTPLVFSKKGTDGEDHLWPAFSGYAIASGTNGFKEASRVWADGSPYETVDANPKPITVTFKYNNTPAVDDVVANALTNTPIGSTIFPVYEERSDHYTVLKWTTAADGTGATITAASTFEANATVYAQWAPPITITLDPNYATGEEVEIVIGTGGSLTAANLAAAEQAGYVFIKWYDKDYDTNKDSAKVITTATTFTADTTIYARWVAKAAVDYVIGNKDDDGDDDDLVVALKNNGSGLAAIEDNVITVTDAFKGVAGEDGKVASYARQSGADQIRFAISQFPDDWRGYETIVIDYSISYAPSELDDQIAMEAVAAEQFKTQIFYAVDGEMGTSINYFDLDNSNDPALTFDVSKFPVNTPDTVDSLAIKCNPYGGKTMQGIITITINSVTFKAFADDGGGDDGDDE